MLLSQLEDLYAKHDEILVCDQGILAKPLEDGKTHSNCQIQNFIKYATPLLKFSIKTAKKNGTKYKPINKHFPPISPTATLESTT